MPFPRSPSLNPAFKSPIPAVESRIAPSPPVAFSPARALVPPRFFVVATLIVHLTILLILLILKKRKQVGREFTHNNNNPTYQADQLL
jgi:hypothetical protein